ncbi:MAG: hypothetical protein NTZ33_14900 [Bacteroidetes bacterium]|nr:hypothetical protein [Bacteroidota bacterium]
MKRLNFILLYSLIVFIFISCNSINTKKSKTALKDEIAVTEKSFETAVKKNGIADAFVAFADDNAVIIRGNDSLIKGKEGIKSFYQQSRYINASVSWKPDFIDVSDDGKLGYTYGKYEWIIIDSLSNKANIYKGIFHTVWKKQSDGSWKYVWD